MAHGGKRPGAGAKKGTCPPVTFEKNALRATARNIIGPHMADLIAAHVAHAKGLSYLVYRDKESGKFERVKAIEDVDQEANAIEVWEKDPSVQSFTDLMNRLMDKPSEHVELTGADGGPLELVARVAAARKRLSDG
jgi:hypothetical protein